MQHVKEIRKLTVIKALYDLADALEKIDFNKNDVEFEATIDNTALYDFLDRNTFTLNFKLYHKEANSVMQDISKTIYLSAKMEDDLE